MFLPYGTDAPIYHWPKATVGLIVANVLVFFATVGMDEDHLMSLVLVHGDGVHPLQWVTSVFIHGGIQHLIGNMIFLWAFGIIVEGKLGALKFLSLYLCVGILECAIEQFLFLRSEPGVSFGASSAIYSLLAVCLVWAPLNELQCLWFWRFTASQIDISILWFAPLYIGMDVAFVVVTAAARSSALYHSAGALIGLVAGVVLLKADLVDCENWDLFAVMAGRKGMTKEKAAAFKKKTAMKAVTRSDDVSKPKKPRSRAAAEPAEDPGDAATRRLRRHFDAGDPMAAHSSYDKAMRTVAGWQPTGPDWLALIKALVDAKEWRTAVATMEDYLRRTEDPSPRVRLKLAQILIRDQQRPAHALRVLEGFPKRTLPPALESFRLQLVSEAEQMREEGVLELEGDVW